MTAPLPSPMNPPPPPPPPPVPPAPPVPAGAEPPTDDQLREARRAVARHRRRRYPDTRFCGLCGQRWHVDRTRSGRPARGCTVRRQALDVLEVAGQLDDAGRPTQAVTP